MVGVSWNSGYWRQIRKYPLPKLPHLFALLASFEGCCGMGGGALGGRQTSGHNVPYSFTLPSVTSVLQRSGPFFVTSCRGLAGSCLLSVASAILGVWGKTKIDWLFLFLCRINKYSSHVTAEKNRKEQTLKQLLEFIFS